MLHPGPPIDEPYCFWKQSAQSNHQYGENVPPKPLFFAFIQPAWSVLWKTLINSMWCTIPHRKGSTHFCRPTHTLPQKWLCPPKIIFRGYFGKYV